MYTWRPQLGLMQGWSLAAKVAYVVGLWVFLLLTWEHTYLNFQHPEPQSYIESNPVIHYPYVAFCPPASHTNIEFLTYDCQLREGHDVVSCDADPATVTGANDTRHCVLFNTNHLTISREDGREWNELELKATFNVNWTAGNHIWELELGCDQAQYRRHSGRLTSFYSWLMRVPYFPVDDVAGDAVATRALFSSEWEKSKKTVASWYYVYSMSHLPLANPEPPVRRVHRDTNKSGLGQFMVHTVLTVDSYSKQKWYKKPKRFIAASGVGKVAAGLALWIAGGSMLKIRNLDEFVAAL
mmetsp:Transcript_63817/g.170984  ORF Transcript_63817/g.170984 Transcript_63817/m.170984 type:complete len:297 (+) Transcript_63817:2-892(+)